MQVRVLLGVAVVLDVINQSMARYPSGRGVALGWSFVDLLLVVAVARGSRAAWLVLSVSTAFGAALFLAAGAGESSGFQVSRGLLFAAQLLVLVSPAVRMRAGFRRGPVEAPAALPER